MVFPIPSEAMDYFHYPLSIDGKRFRDETGFEPSKSLEDIVENLLLDCNHWRLCGS